LAAFDRHTHVLAKIASFPHPVAGRLVEFPHFGIGVSKNDPAAVGRSLPLTVPAVDQIVAGLLACCSGMHHVVTVIGVDRIAGSARRQIAGGVPLPVVALAADLMDFDSALSLMDRSEGRARL